MPSLLTTTGSLRMRAEERQKKRRGEGNVGEFYYIFTLPHDKYCRHGSSYPSDSAQKISEQMARVVLEGGGEVLCNAMVTRIVRTNKGVAKGVTVSNRVNGTAQEYTVHANAIVNAAGLHHLYRKEGLLDDSALTALYSQQRFRPSMSHAYLFVCLRGTIDQLHLPRTNMWCLRGSGSGANNIDGAFDSFLASPTSTSTPPPAIYITFPCAKESNWHSRYPSISNAIVFCDCEYSLVEEWRDDVLHNRSNDYQDVKDKLGDALLHVLLEKRPDLKDKIVWCEVGTPLTSENYLGAYRGGDYGTRVDVDYFSKEGLQWLMTPTTKVPNLFQSGQDAMTPSISGAMHGGVLCAWRMAGLFGMVRSIITVMQFQFHARRRIYQNESAVISLLKVLKSWAGDNTPF